jgi:two-component system, NtrC family, nitrogen regulation sensor histidine kinase NtrY
MTSVAQKADGEDPRVAPQLDATERSFSIGLVVVVLSVISAFTTYLILTGLTPITPRDEVVLTALLVNVALILAMIALIAWQCWGLWQAWRDEVPGSRLHVRIVALFSIIAALPAILLAVAATTTFSRAIDSWFSVRTRAIIDNSLDVAQQYLEEHGQLIRADVANMARDLDATADLMQGDQVQLRQLLIAQAGLRELPVAYLVDLKGQRIISALEDDRLPYLKPPQSAIDEANGGQIAVIRSTEKAQITALSKLARYPDKLLYVARLVSPKVMNHLARTEQNVDEYNRLRKARGGLKLAHGLIYTMISMTALLAAIWSGLWFAGKFVAPIRRLIAGAQVVSTGNLDVELPERRGEGDLRRLSSTLSERRRFMEAVLSGVSAGIIGLDSEDRITLLSRSAESLLETSQEAVVGRKLSDALPAFAFLLETPEDTAIKPKSQHEVSMLIGTEERTFSVRITQEKAAQGDVGSVVTFDDISELVTAQRTSAWGDVARRIAHEIKNPLTPIILSAERIRKKYGKVIIEDRETFDKLTATIERQAGDIKTMVDEFAAFARVPKPVMEQSDVRDAVHESVILFRESHPNLTYDLNLPEAPVLAAFDRRLITQAVTNLVKNATEAVESAAQTPNQPKGRIETTLRVMPDRYQIEVIDNGIGLPKQNRSKLLEPYVTTKGHKGTGLGLAIVQKITEQHGGTLVLDDAPAAPDRATGAAARITLPFRSVEQQKVELQSSLDHAGARADKAPDAA